MRRLRNRVDTTNILDFSDRPFSSLNRRQRSTHYTNTSNIWSELYDNVVQSSATSPPPTAMDPIEDNPTTNPVGDSESIPLLSETNTTLFTTIIAKYATAQGQAWLLCENEAAPSTVTTADAIKMTAAMQCLILSKTSEEMLDKLPDDFITATPATMISHIKSSLCAATPEQWQLLEEQARRRTFQRSETLEEYISAHRRLRRMMIACNYPITQSKSTTIRFILDGLATHPAYRQIPTLIRFSGILHSILLLQQRLSAVDTETTAFNQHPRRPTFPYARTPGGGSYATPLRREHAERPPRGYDRNRGRGHNRRGRGRPSPKYAYHNSVAYFNDTPLDDPSTGGCKFILDSAAHPSQLNFTTRESRPLTNPPTVYPAFGPPTKATHSTNLTIQTSTGATMKTRALTTPSIRSNLLRFMRPRPTGNPSSSPRKRHFKYKTEDGTNYVNGRLPHLTMDNTSYTRTQPTLHKV